MKRWKKYSLPTKTSILGAIFSITAGIIASLLSFLGHIDKNNTTIENKIKELDNIQIALETIDNYVGSQKETLKDLSSELNQIKTEKEQIQKILEIDKEKLDTLLAYQESQSKKKMWINMIISFFTGVLSSSVVTYIAIRYQKRKDLVNG